MTSVQLQHFSMRIGGAGIYPQELLLPSLGGRGVYVLDWPSALRLCTPTLHDRQLWDRVEALPRPGPVAYSLRRLSRTPLADSVTLSVAFFTAPLAWSVLPSASVRLSPVTLPTTSLTVPVILSAVPEAMLLSEMNGLTG